MLAWTIANDGLIRRKNKTHLFTYVYSPAFIKLYVRTHRWWETLFLSRQVFQSIIETDMQCHFSKVRLGVLSRWDWLLRLDLSVSVYLRLPSLCIFSIIRFTQKWEKYLIVSIAGKLWNEKNDVAINQKMHWKPTFFNSFKFFADQLNMFAIAPLQFQVWRQPRGYI